MASWLEWGYCPECKQYCAMEFDTDTGEIYFWHTDTGERECSNDNAEIDLKDYAFHLAKGGE